MKPQGIVPIDRELILPEDRYILSATDISGKIVSVNDLFIEYSGYNAQELIGQQHNIVRHPDMPRSVFWLAWDMLSAGEAFQGYVKNLSRNGSFYWVFSNIVPLTDASGTVTGFSSIRRHARPAAVSKASALYARMLAAERAAGPKDAIRAGLDELSAYLAELGMSYEAMVARL